MRRLVMLAALATGPGLLACDRSTEDCGGHCGAGTVCEADKCVVAPGPEPEAEPEPEEPSDKKRRRRRRKDGGDPATGGGLPDRDANVPRYRADRLEEIGEGSERISDRRIRQELAEIEPAFNRCLARASEVSDATLSGTVSFQIGIEPTGKVWGVNATLPSSWGVPGLKACFRNAVYEHRFPSWDGPATGVDYHFTVD
ncbi:MAG: hypothetical protein H6712_28280 [Myxococcales bacterium]|nr:hypothetical protein [Myxococcales bacterium]